MTVRVGFPAPARSPRRPLAWAATLACLLHAWLWWAWPKAGVLGEVTQPMSLPAPMATRVLRLDPVPAEPPPERPSGLQGEGRPVPADRAPAAVATVVGALPEASEGASALTPAWLKAHHWPAEALDRSPQPELGWFLDENALAALPHARLTVRLWVSASGQIEHVALLEAEPATAGASPSDARAPAWALRALQPLRLTPMRPGEQGGRPVPATLVVELSSDHDRLR